MKISEVMTPDAQCISPAASVVEAAEIMRQLDVGALPVCDHHRVVGMITDRDIVVRAVAPRGNLDGVTVGEIMSPEIISIFDDASIEEAVRTMERHQIRRLPVVNHHDRIVGMLSLGDLAVEATTALSGEVLKEVSNPAAPVR
jgi:CBS domain-containing protein